MNPGTSDNGDKTGFKNIGSVFFVVFKTALKHLPATGNKPVRREISEKIYKTQLAKFSSL